MEQFLKMVAEGYGRKYDLSRLTFVMPNKRSGSFLLKKIQEASVRTEIAPRILSVTDFVAEHCDEVIDSRLDLVFRLYSVFCSLRGDIDTLTFEKFCSWGETLLSDFNEVDMQMVDVDNLFKNVKDLNQIRSDFLTEEQRAVMVEYFGYSPDIIERDTTRLWKSLGDESDDADGVKKKFRSLWDMLNPLYREFKESLGKDGLTTNGGAYRSVAEKIEKGYEPYPGEKIVFVGFNALSESERRMFVALRDLKIDLGNGEESKADFIWDTVSPYLTMEGDPSVRFIEVNSRAGNFPSPKWFDEYYLRCVPSEPPKIEVISVPSNIMQVKVAREELEKIHASIPEEMIHDARVAVILPDENLLLPLLYSLPDAYPNPNLTMGFPLKQTSVVGFTTLLRKLHRRSRKAGDEAVFLFEDVRDLLGHPYAYILFAKKDIRVFVRESEQKKVITVSSEMLGKLGANSAMVFHYLGEGMAPGAIIRYIYEVLKTVRDGMGRDGGTYLRTKVERTYIESYMDALVRLDNCIKAYDVSLSASAVFQLADRLIAGETVAFEGEPLQGLQVMGVLETRCLDFDRIIMLSVNEKVMPRVGRNATFIPAALRNAFGMPPAGYQEELFAYYFFRVLGRSSHAILTYDSRSTEVRTAGPSRYLLQMKYLSDKIDPVEREKRFGMPVNSASAVEIAKDGYIKERVDRFSINSPAAAEHGPRNFSATALDHYFNCPVRFLYNDVLELYVEVEKQESIDAMDMGTIVHEAMEKLYVEGEAQSGVMLKKPILVTEEKLRHLLTAKNEKGESLIERAAKDAILRVHFGATDEERRENGELRGSAAIILDYIVQYIRDIIQLDLGRVPFRIWGCEIKEVVEYTLSSGDTVSLKMVIDRLDQEGSDGFDHPFRVVDYKTGSVHLKAEDLRGVFSGDYAGKHIFQLLIYATLLNRLIDEGRIELPAGVEKEKFKRELQTVIYNIPEILDKNKGVSKIEIGATTVNSIEDLEAVESGAGETFMGILEEKLMEILDPTKPFGSHPDEDKCRYCDQRLRCEVARYRK